MSYESNLSWRRYLSMVTLLILTPLLLFALSGFWRDKTEKEGLAMAKESVRRAAVECYALEGFYPPSLDYLIGRYGVTLDESHYFVDYQYIASNLMPDITVLAISN
ncbi:hypothetical protein SDC9_70162 [bioreactor metagenome]|uniref:Uncharacterized protein n=1 Tax=bioreactor metagenome TaxID=1076179 RepID=A0A644Y6W8_9ZZZZ